MERAPGSELTLRERREQTVSRLCEHFAQDQLTLEELERRIDVAQRAQDPAELATLLADLQPKLPATPEQTQPAPRPVAAVDVDRRQNGMLVAVMGGVERRGAWTPAANTFVLTLMGGAELDFRDAILPPGITEIFILSIMGGVEIIVPPNLAVDSGGFAIMGGFGHTTPTPRGDPNAPVLKIEGFALMGGVDISVRRPGETAKDAKRRLRDERRLKRGE